MRSSGPGGQSVNTTNSKAQIRLKIASCSAIDEYIAGNLRRNYRNIISKDDEIIVRSQTHKSQGSNLEECLNKLKKMIYECSIIEQERRYDIPPESPAQKEQRLHQKKIRSEIKSLRQKGKDF